MNHASLDPKLLDRVSYNVTIQLLQQSYDFNMTLIRTENYTLSIGVLTFKALTIFKFFEKIEGNFAILVCCIEPN